MRLSLLRAATLPDAEQDQGHHAFSFAILPHRGSFAESDVPAVARIFNYPLHLRVAASPTPRQGRENPFQLKGDRNVVLDTVKRGEDDHFGKQVVVGGEESVILRLYEAYGGGAKVGVVAKLPQGKKIVKAAITDVRRSLSSFPLLR